MEAAGKRYITHASRSDEFTIWNLSDLHIGNKATAISQLKRDIAKIAADPFSFWLGGGDYAEYISPSDRRFDPACVSESLTVRDMGRLGATLTAQVRDLFRPIAGKCLGLLLGNHELHYQRAKEQAHLHSWLCEELGVPNLEYSALFDLCFYRAHRGKPKLHFEKTWRSVAGGEGAFRFYVHHGAGFATTPGGKLNKLIQFMQMVEAQVYMIGHVHDQKGQRLVRIGADRACRELISQDRVGVISGSYLRTYAQGVTTYGEEKGYAPVPLGASFVRIKPDEGRVTGEI